MAHCKQRLWIGLALGAIWLAAGCRDSTAPPETGESAGSVNRGGPADDVGRPVPATGRGRRDSNPVPPPAATIPEVHLTDQDMQECFVFVEDMMPAIELPNLEGQTTILSELYGEQGTIIFFWKDDGLAASSNLEDLEIDFAKRRAGQGVNVVGVAVDDAETVNSVVQQAQTEFPMLLDTSGEALAKVGTEKLLPRIYLLDAEGKILWFDIEFSQSTTRDLTTALDVAVGPVKE